MDEGWREDSRSRLEGELEGVLGELEKSGKPVSFGITSRRVGSKPNRTSADDFCFQLCRFDLGICSHRERTVELPKMNPLVLKRLEYEAGLLMEEEDNDDEEGNGLD